MIANNNITDMRTISGRVVLLPQTRATLTNTLTQIFQNTNPNDLKDPLQYNMPPAEQTNLLANIGSIEFVSTPLSGLTSDLLTLHDGGMHVKPTVRLPNSTPLAIDTAAAAWSGSGVGSNVMDVMQMMDTETTYVPYGSSVDVDPNAATPFKPVTHGREPPHQSRRISMHANLYL